MRHVTYLFWLALVLITTSGSVSAQTADELRAMYFRGDIVRMEEIARAGNVRAEAWMGLMLQNKGRRLEAKEWWRRAAEKGDPWAISSLAGMHLMDKEDEKAVRWYKRGAELGELDAQNTYAWLLLQGRGVDKDEQAAAREYLAAALRGHGYSFLDVAKLYASGTGVTRDPVEAYAFAYIAEALVDESDLGLGGFAQLNKQLTSELSSAQLRAAKRRAQAIRPDVDELRSARIQSDLQLWIYLCVALGLLVITTIVLLCSTKFLIRRVRTALVRSRVD